MNVTSSPTNGGYLASLGQAINKRDHASLKALVPDDELRAQVYEQHGIPAQQQQAPAPEQTALDNPPAPQNNLPPSAQNHQVYFQELKRAVDTQNHEDLAALVPDDELRQKVYEQNGIPQPGENPAPDEATTAEPAERNTVTIERGDTIWGHVKEALGPDASNADINAATQQVLDANNLTLDSARFIQPGDVIDLSVLGNSSEPADTTNNNVDNTPPPETTEAGEAETAPTTGGNPPDESPDDGGGYFAALGKAILNRDHGALEALVPDETPRHRVYDQHGLAEPGRLPVQYNEINTRDITDEERRELDDTLGIIPGNVQDFLTENGTVLNVIAGDDVSVDTVFPGAAGVFFPDGRRVTVDIDGLGVEAPGSVLTHEIGHAFDFALGNGNFMSLQDEFRRLIDSNPDWVNNPATGLPGATGDSRYIEGFARAFNDFFLQDALQANNPNHPALPADIRNYIQQLISSV